MFGFQCASTRPEPPPMADSYSGWEGSLVKIVIIVIIIIEIIVIMYNRKSQSLREPAGPPMVYGTWPMADG